MTDFYDKRVYDLRNTTLEEVFNNENKETDFQVIGLQESLFDSESSPETEE